MQTTEHAQYIARNPSRIVVPIKFWRGTTMHLIAVSVDGFRTYSRARDVRGIEVPTCDLDQYSMF